VSGCASANAPADAAPTEACVGPKPRGFQVTSRIENFHDLSAAFAAMSDADLLRDIGNVGSEQGWGTNHIIDVSGKRVFVKKIPLTAREHENPRSLDNLFDLPSFYNYALMSAGLGAYRELHAHLTTTKAVLAGEMKNVPLLFHYRIVDRPRPAASIDETEHADVVRNWANSAQIGSYLRARHEAPFEIVLCLEHFPSCLGFAGWFATNTHRIWDIADTIFKAITDMRRCGLLHFDCQFNNIVTNGTEFFLTDFGLTMPERACHTRADRNFYDQHRFHPEAVFLASCSWHLVFQYLKLPKDSQDEVVETAEITDRNDEFLVGIELLDALERLEETDLQLSGAYRSFLFRYREPIQIAKRFTHAMIHNDAKNTPSVQAEFERALRRTAGPDGKGSAPIARARAVRGGAS
jgi:hypothetical protein